MLIDEIIAEAENKLEKANWKCHCSDCLLSKIREFTDDDFCEIIKNYDENFLY